MVRRITNTCPPLQFSEAGAKKKSISLKSITMKLYGTDRLYVTSCPVAGCTSGLVTTEIELEASKRPWTLHEVKALAIGNTLYIAFLADNNDTANQEVYLYNSPGGGTGTLNKLTAATMKRPMKKLIFFW